MCVEAQEDISGALGKSATMAASVRFLAINMVTGLYLTI